MNATTTSSADAYARVRRVTDGEQHHWFGYYEKTPWDASGRYLLAMRAGFADRQPEPGESAAVGIIDLQRGNRFRELDRTDEWSWQQGCMLQWLGNAPDRLAIYNCSDGHGWGAVVRDVHSGEVRTLGRPIYAVGHDGREAFSLNFHRLHVLRPGYGYVSPRPHHLDQLAPDDDGVFHLDLDTGRSRLIVSLAQLAAHQPREAFDEVPHWVNHIQVSPDTGHIAFLHRWRPPSGPQFLTRLYVCRPDGSELRLLSDTGLFSHYDWRDERTILGWAADACDRRRFYLSDIERGRGDAFGEGILTTDGHCSFSPDRQWLLTDTYPTDHHRTLILYHIPSARRIDIGRFYSPPHLAGPCRCDLHPRWSRDGREVCIDSAHEGSRQMYVLDVSPWTAA